MAKTKSIFGILLFLMASVSSAENDGWVDLLNGKDLSGWKQISGNAIYEVINGELVGTTVANDKELPAWGGSAKLTPLDYPSNSFLATEKRYTDFVLELEMFAGDMNGGIQFRSNSDPDYWSGLVHGYQAEVDPSDRAWSAGIFDEMRRGWLYPGSFNPNARNAFKAKDWNHYRIECIGNSLRTWLNGVPVSHVIDDMSPAGFIALQVHFAMRDSEVGQQIRWRNIRIKTENLSPAPSENIFVANYLPDNLSDAEKRQGWILLDEEELTERGEDRQTVDNYKAFDFQFEFKASEGAKSAITYFTHNNDSSSGHEYLILPNNDVNGTESTGSLSGLISAKETRNHPGAPFEREWNRGRIVAKQGGSVEHWLNGYLVLEYKLGSDEFRTLVASSEHADSEGFGIPRNSPIVIRDQEGSVQFRSLKIRKLTISH